jgi:hypothetical protein
MSRTARSKHWLLWAGGFLALVLLFSQDLLAQCPMCRTALAQSEEGQRWARGINAGIFLLLAAPFVIAATAALVIYRPQVTAAVSRIRWRPLRSVPARARQL